MICRPELPGDRPFGATFGKVEVLLFLELHWLPLLLLPVVTKRRKRWKREAGLENDSTRQRHVAQESAGRAECPSAGKA
jgi:hypothetical protein